MIRGILLSLLVAAACVAAAAPPPNVVIIYTDEHRFDALGVMGNPDLETPHIDALAEDGVLYRNSFATWPVCTPSRFSLLTGQYVHQHSGRSNRSTLPPGTPTFATILRDKGYGTAAVGKMHITPAYQDVGFDRMLLAEQNGRGRNIDDYHRYLKDRGLINALDLIDQEWRFRQHAPDDYWETFGAMVSDLPDEHHITTWVGDRAVDEVNGWTDDQSNVLFVGFLKPHHPFDPPAPWHERYAPEDMTILPGWTDEVPKVDADRHSGYFDNTSLTKPALRKVMAYYYATITHLDHHVGRIVAALKRNNLYDNTLIVMTADHGDFLGFHHLLLKGNHMYDPVIKVPLVIKYPGQRHAGAVTGELVNSLDVTATILRETGGEGTTDMRGEPLGIAGPGRERPRDIVFAQDARSLMARTANRKLIFDERPGRSLYFNLKADPYELDNQIENPDYATEIATLTDAGLRWFIRETARNAYIDENAPIIDGPNIPNDLEATEAEMLQYFEENVRPILKEE